MSAVHYASFTQARIHLKDLFDAAESGKPAGAERDRRRFAVVEADRLRRTLALVCPSQAQLVAEEGGWSIFLPDQPIAADGATVDEAVAEMVTALREYAQDWSDLLLHAPNHQDNWGLVQLIHLSDDGQLAEWLLA